MAIISYTEMFWGFVGLFFFYHWIRDRNSIFTNWPIVGILPGALWNLPHLHEYVTEGLKQSEGTYRFRGPRFCNMDFLITSDPMNAQHILSKNFSNYIKGPDFGKNFELFGDGIFTVDSDSWKFQRKMIHSYLKDSRFQLLLERTIQEKVANSLFPVLDRVCTGKVEVNLEDVFMRLGFDIACVLFLGCDPKCLSVESPQVPYDKAIGDAMESMIYRHAVPEKYWKLLKWLQIGTEKRLTQGLKIFDDFVYRCIASRRENYLHNKTKMEERKTNFDFLTAYLMEEEGESEKSDCKFLRDVVTNIVVAGRDTSSAGLSWFFWLLARNQSVETKIVEEIKEKLLQKEDGKQTYIIRAEEVRKLIYLHAALCETLRLYPSVPMNLKYSVLPDKLPSGRRVKENTKVIISSYAMARMEEIWGEDCCEFKPERWIAKGGGIRQVRPYKFTTFGAGPRTCAGKDTSLAQMKIVAVAVILKYHFQLVQDHLVVPNASMILHMKHGLKVRVTKRSI